MRSPTRPTMGDVAKQAQVGIATVDRVLNRRAPVKAETARRVLDAAEAIGFHAAPLLKKRVDDAGQERTFAFLLQKGGQSFYQALAHALTHATRQAESIRGKAVVRFLEDLTPTHVARALDELAAHADALAIVAADHPQVSAAIERAAGRGRPIFTLLSDLSSPARAGFIGIDHRKAGRSAAWAVSRLSARPGAVAIFVGSHRYLGHELSEISFRSYLREHATGFSSLEAVTSFEDAQFAQEATRDLLRRCPDLVGLYVAGGGIEGVIEALRESGDQSRPVVVCNELMPETRTAMIDGIVDLVISTPIDALARVTVASMIAALKGQPAGTTLLPFDLFIPENI